MQSIIGSPVQGKNLFGREREIARCWELLEMDHLLIPAPRRVGKTSVMKALVAEAKIKNFQAIYFTVEGESDEEGFINALYNPVVACLHPAESMMTRTVDSVGNKLGNITKFGPLTWGESTKKGWRQVGGRLQKILQDDSRRWLLLVDELPVFLGALIRSNGDGTERARQLLDWLRSLRGPAFGHVRWVFCGSIGLDSMTERHKMTTSINDLRKFSLSPFSTATARSFLAALADSYQVPLSPPVVERVLERCGWLIPFHLQLLFDALRGIWEENSDVALLPEQVDAAFDTILAPGGRSHFIHWKDRLLEELGSVEGNHALFLLGLSATPPTGESRAIMYQALAVRISDGENRDEILDNLLTLLERDGYLVAESGRYRFRSPLLREFWLRHVSGRVKQ